MLQRDISSLKVSLGGCDMILCQLQGKTSKKLWAHMSYILNIAQQKPETGLGFFLRILSMIKLGAKTLCRPLYL